MVGRDVTDDAAKPNWIGVKFPEYLMWRMSPHGHVMWDAMVRRANQMAAVMPHYGMHGIMETARFHTTIALKDADGFKISNSWEPYLAREMTYAKIVPEKFYEIVGGTPPWMQEWATRPDRLEPPPNAEGLTPAEIARAVLNRLRHTRMQAEADQQSANEANAQANYERDADDDE